MQVRIPPVEIMDDETLMKHLEHRHGNELAMTFEIEPGREERRLHAPAEWRTFHETMRHDGDHEHSDE